MKKWMIASSVALLFSATTFANSDSLEEKNSSPNTSLQPIDIQIPQQKEEKEITPRDVLFAKQRLSEMGYYKGKLSDTDVQEPQFIQAVQIFQKENLLPVTGVLDYKTMQALTVKTTLDSEPKNNSIPSPHIGKPTE